MKQLLDFIPLLVFFVAFKIYDIYIATGALIAASLIQIFAFRALFGQFNKMHIWMFVILLLFGTMTILTQDTMFLKWKVTITESILATILLVSQLVFKKPLIGILFKNIKINPPLNVMNKINMMWVLFFYFIAVLNLFVAFGLPEIMEDQEKALEYWVNFKVWGIMALSLIVVIGTAIKLSPYAANIREQDNNDSAKNEIEKIIPEDRQVNEKTTTVADQENKDSNVKIF